MCDPFQALRPLVNAVDTWAVNTLRLIVLGIFIALVLYYVRAFIVIQHQASTIVQICLLLIGAAVAVTPMRAAWRLTALQARLTALAAVGLSAAIFIWIDQSSHSVSDSLNGAVPSISVLVTMAVRLATHRLEANGLAARR